MKTVVKSMFGGAKASWKKRKMDLVLKSEDDVGPILRWAPKKKEADKDGEGFRVVLEGCTCADNDERPTKKAYAFQINHPTYAEPKLYYVEKVRAGVGQRGLFLACLLHSIRDPIRQSRA